MSGPDVTSLLFCTRQEPCVHHSQSYCTILYVLMISLFLHLSFSVVSFHKKCLEQWAQQPHAYPMGFLFHVVKQSFFISTFLSASYRCKHFCQTLFSHSCHIIHCINILFWITNWLSAIGGHFTSFWAWLNKFMVRTIELGIRIIIAFE